MRYGIKDVASGKIVFTTDSEWIATEMFEAYRDAWGKYEMVVRL